MGKNKKTEIALVIGAIYLLNNYKNYNEYDQLRGSANISDANWLDNFENAKAQATAEGKLILMVFTGSDWCSPCKELHNNVLVKEIFKEEMPEHYILLMLSYPSDNSEQTDAAKAQYKELAHEYKVPGVPAVFLADADGNPLFKSLGYVGQSADEWVGQMVGKSDIPNALAKAEKANGSKRAQLLDTALTMMGFEFSYEFYGEKIDEIIKLDSENKVSLKVKYEKVRKVEKFKEALKQIQTAALKQIQTANGDAEPEMLATSIDELVKKEKATGELLQHALFAKSSIMFIANKKDDAEKLLLEAKKVAPNSDTAKHIDIILKIYFGK